MTKLIVIFISGFCLWIGCQTVNTIETLMQDRTAQYNVFLDN